ncbi:CYTH and CHAD domain-containing protein [Acinetobacter seifertii]|uniref:CYTH and CHAD domain-containing protein n=1 Tax=Acinetobacter seifertii TaxID=1530123 RepID=UPI000C1DCE53|nr:CYTH and CHAD domain-containing protein [Acinetobacter seifertii]PJF03964.1 inorganic triphosphatase [Acinetobacter seifertii]PJG69909.1 inorganic triphosphatase [Acinetobacter seifertii]
MVEVELKFQLPESKKKTVLQYLKKHKAQNIHLQAKYYDTPNRLLAKNGMALRLRKENDLWVQTFKAAGQSHLHRVEEEVFLGKCEQEPELNLELYKDNKAVTDLLTQALGTEVEKLSLQFETDVHRTYHVFEADNTAIEVCLDDGVVKTATVQSKICEVEFELKQGAVKTLIQFAQQWINRYELWLDVRSKAERGNLLALGKAVSPAVHAKNLSLDKNISPEQALKKIVENCLGQFLPNMAAIADNVAEAEHIHQARVSLRRLRSALHHFSGWSDDLNPTWEEQIAALFRKLGNTRDLDAIRTEILPMIVQHGSPELLLPISEEPLKDLATLFKSAETVKLVLALLAFAYSEEDSQSTKGKFKKQIEKSLDKLHHQVLSHAKDFNELEVTEQHKIRKKAKQLRYCIELISSLYPSKNVQQFLKKLQPVQNTLGLYNDLFIAEDLFNKAIEHDPHFWFALGWIKAKQPYLQNQSAESLQKFNQVKTFW